MKRKNEINRIKIKHLHIVLSSNIYSIVRKICRDKKIQISGFIQRAIWELIKNEHKDYLDT
mgnify:CR=1 FL=1